MVSCGADLPRYLFDFFQFVVPCGKHPPDGELFCIVVRKTPLNPTALSPDLRHGSVVLRPILKHK